MKHTFITFFTLFVSLSASSEFKYIEPISVEEAPREFFISKPEEIVPKTKKTQKTTNPITIIVKKEDSDGDGVSDKNDKCPNTLKNFIVNSIGCPQITTLNVKFASKQYKTDKKIIDSLRDFASFLKKNKNYQVIIYGYTDSIGDAIKNKKLSQKRADAIKEGLISLGISSTKLTAIGRGEENPIANNMYKDGREKNRRIEIELIE